MTQGKTAMSQQGLLVILYPYLHFVQNNTHPLYNKEIGILKKLNNEIKRIINY